MFRIITAGAVALVAAGFTVQAMADDTVGVNIVVDEVVSLWSNDAQINLVMNGFDGNNAAWAASDLSVITNTDATVKANVTGVLPAPIVPGGGIQFHIFNGHVDASVLLVPNAYNPPGAVSWNEAQLGEDRTLIASTGVQTSIETFDITYAASAPGEIPLPNSYDLVVTYTIADATP